MSARHRLDRQMGRVTPPRQERAAAHRHVRRAAHAELHMALVGADPDELVTTEPVRTPYLPPREAGADVAPAPSRRSRLRHWKQRSWKRRTAQRARRAEAERALATAG